MLTQFLKHIILCLFLNLFISDESCSRFVAKFCDHNYIDAVLWDGNSYRLTRNEWIAEYDVSTKTVKDFVHKSDSDFPNEKHFYYQSGYYIPTVPDCNHTTKSCQLMRELVGLTVFAIRDTGSGQVIHRVVRTSDHKLLLNELNANYFFESNLMPKRLTQKYKPSVYSPNDYMFIHLTNKYRNIGPLIETIELHANGVIERTYYDIYEPSDLVFITSFWWTFDNKVYIIGEHRLGFGKALVYELINTNGKFLIKSINKTMAQFFGCNDTKHKILSLLPTNSSIESHYEYEDYSGYTNRTLRDEILAEKQLTFGHMFAVIIFFTLPLLATLMLTFGFVSVYYLNNILMDENENDLTNELNERKLKFAEELTEFFIEEYENSPKAHLHSYQTISCQTIDSFDD